MTFFLHSVCSSYVADADFEYGATFSVTSDDPDVNGLWESILSGDAHLETLIQVGLLHCFDTTEQGGQLET